MTDTPTICWHGSPRTTRCQLDHDGDVHYIYGRCRSGRRWFWSVSSLRSEYEAHGWQDTEEAAMDAGRAAIVAFGRNGVVLYAATFASETLKQVNAAKRAARPPSDSTTSKPIEYLFSTRYHDSDMGDSYTAFVRFQIVRKTAKRIFYLDFAEEVDEQSGEPVDRDYPRFLRYDAIVRFVDRSKLEAFGRARKRSRRRWDDGDLYASLQVIRDHYRHPHKAKPDIAKLKAEMAAAHPDHGGSSAAFIKARLKYVEARRRARSSAA